MNVRELIEKLSVIDDQERAVAVTISYQTGDHSPVMDVGTEGAENVYLFPATCLDGDCP